MGATGIYTPYSNVRECIKRHLIEDFDSELGGKNLKLVDYSIQGNLLWILYSVLDKGINSIAVISCSKHKDEFVYKCVEDNMGPYQLGCPQKLLERATSTNPTAVNWYDKCRAFIAANKEIKSIVKNLQKVVNPTNVQVVDVYGRGMRFERIQSDSYYIAVAESDGRRYKYGVKDLPLDEWHKIAQAQ